MICRGRNVRGTMKKDFQKSDEMRKAERDFLRGKPAKLFEMPTDPGALKELERQRENILKRLGWKIQPPWKGSE